MGQTAVQKYAFALNSTLQHIKAVRSSKDWTPAGKKAELKASVAMAKHYRAELSKAKAAKAAAARKKK